MHPTLARPSRIPILLLVTAIAVLVWASVQAGPSLSITAWNTEGNHVLATVHTSTGQDGYVKVTALYHDGKDIHSGDVIVFIADGDDEDVDIELQTITDDINPMGMVEGPDPIPTYVALNPVMTP